MSQAVGVIGGTGLYLMEGLEGIREVEIDTPFGKPSDSFVTGRYQNTDLVFLPRHGRGHRLLPNEVNFRANIFGMKKLGVTSIVSVSAVGSLREEIAPGHMVIPDQFIDRTTQRPNSFFGRGIVAHVSLADPFCPVLREIFFRAAQTEGATVHPGGTYLCMEGPQFSTRAESHLYRNWGAHVIGMTNLQEARLAREAEICYVTLALAADYDCWNPKAGDVDIQQVVDVLQRTVRLAQDAIRRALADIPELRRCPCATALKECIITDKTMITEQARKELEPLVGRYL